MKKPLRAERFSLVVVPPGFEPGLFGTKIRRVASYTTGQRVDGKITNFFVK